MVAASFAAALLSLAGVLAIFAVFAWVGERIDGWHSARGEVGNGNPNPSRTEDRNGTRRDPRAETPGKAA